MPTPHRQRPSRSRPSPVAPPHTEGAAEGPEQAPERNLLLFGIATLLLATPLYEIWLPGPWWSPFLLWALAIAAIPLGRRG